MSRLRLGAASLASVAVLLAGCASNSTKPLTGPTHTTANAPSTTASADGNATTTTVAAGPASTTVNGDTITTAVADGPASTTANGDTNATAAADGGAEVTTQETAPASGDAFPGLSGQCKAKYANYLAKVSQLASGPETYKELGPLLNELLAGAPADVQAAAKPVLDAFAKFAAIIDKYNGDIVKASQDPDFAMIETSLSSADTQAAGKKVEDWLKSTCGG